MDPLETEVSTGAEAPKFERRGFSDKPAEVETTVEEQTLEGLPETIEVGADPNAEPEAVVEPAVEEENYRIGGKTFKTQKEAWAYAEELEQKTIADDAFRQGVEAARGVQESNVVPPPQIEEDVPLDYYTNPAKYLKEREAQVKAQIKAEMAAEAQKERTNRETWEKFYNDYQDLEPARELVDDYTNKHWSRLQHMSPDKGLKEIAEGVRAKLKQYGVIAMPKQELKRVTQTASSGSQQTVTTKKQDQKPLSFVEMSRKLRAEKQNKRK